MYIICKKNRNKLAPRLCLQNLVKILQTYFTWFIGQLSFVPN